MTDKCDEWDFTHATSSMIFSASPENSLHSGHPSPLDREAAHEIKRLRAEVRDWQENYKQAMDGRVSLRAENTKLRETLGALVEFADRFLPGNPTVEKARAALQKDEGK